MTEIILRRTMGGLTADPESEAVPFLQRIAVGTLVVADVKDPRRRSSQHHKWLFALLNKVWANQTYFKSVDHLRHALLVRLGHYDTVQLKSGQIVHIPHSMAYSKMSREEWDAFARDAVTFLCEEVIPGLDENDLRREIEEMVA